MGGKPYFTRLSGRYFPTGFTHFPHLYNISLEESIWGQASQLHKIESFGIGKFNE